MHIDIIGVPVGDLPDDNPKARYKNAIADINKRLSDAVAGSLAQGHRPVILGGDHSIAAGSLLGTQRVHGKVGVIWMDAHGDFNNEETTLSGNLHGMHRVMRNALDVAESGMDALHTSFDLDVVTPSEAPGVGTPVPGGLTYREAHLAVSVICSMLGKRIFRSTGENL